MTNGEFCDKAVFVLPVKTGISPLQACLDPRLRGDDEIFKVIPMTEPKERCPNEIVPQDYG